MNFFEAHGYALQFDPRTLLIQTAVKIAPQDRDIRLTADLNRDAWLTGKAGAELLRPAPDGLLRMWPISRWVNESVRGYDDPSLIEPVGVAARTKPANGHLCLAAITVAAVDIGGAMTRVVSTIRIRRDIADVFDFFTTPENWPEWHPASISVAGATDHSLAIGEEVTEEFLAAGRRGSAVWRVTAREAPCLWRIESSATEASATITYRLHTDAGMTVFERDMQYYFGPPMISPKAMFLRLRMERESREALFRAKQILEKS
jgi:hypothetical protein